MKPDPLTLSVNPTYTYINSNQSYLSDIVFLLDIISSLMLALPLNFSQSAKERTKRLVEKEECLSTFVNTHTRCSYAR